jgi:hypothetical protein
VGHRFEKVIVDHANRPKTTTGQTFDEFDAVFPVLTFEQMRTMAILVPMDSGVFAEYVQQFVTTRHRARECPADADVMFSGRFPTKHRIERHQLQNVDRLKIKFRGDPGDGLVFDIAVMFLDQV